MKLSKVTLKKQPADRGALLERNAKMWAVVVQKVIPRPRLSPEELAEHTLAVIKGERAGETRLSDAHLLAIGLRQIEQHLRRLKRMRTGFRTPHIAQAAKQFLVAYNTGDVNNLRHLLEHQAEYIVGGGKYRRLVVDLHESIAFGSDSTEPEESVWVSVFGRKFRVDPIVRAAAALEVALREGSQPPQEGGDSARTVSAVLPVSGTPGLPLSFTEEDGRGMLAALLAHEQNSDEYRTVVNLLREALSSRERR
jgi:hypothetical protein